MDFSYHSFDFSCFDNCFFDRTQFQYSSFQYASLKNTTWIYAQGSPTSFVRSDLSDSIIKDSFFMFSDFEKACINNLVFPGSGIEQANFSYETTFSKLKF